MFFAVRESGIVIEVAIAEEQLPPPFPVLAKFVTTNDEDDAGLVTDKECD